MIRSKNRSISRNLTVGLVVVIVVISMAFISIYYYQMSDRLKAGLEKTADDYIRSIASALEIPLWNLDRESIDVVCDYYKRNDLVVMVEMVGVSGEVMYRNEAKEEIGEGNLIGRSRELFHNGEKIGRVMIALSPSRLEGSTLELLKVSIAALLISVAGLVFSTGFLLKKLLREPMDFLGRIARSYSRGDYHPPLDGIVYREFEPLVSVLVDMGATIESQMKELRRAEGALKKHRDHLEEMVARRTGELEISNAELRKEIQEREHAEEDLRANEQWMGAILKASPFGIGLVARRRVCWANETMHRLLGYEKDTLEGVETRVLYKDQWEFERVGNVLLKAITRSETGSVETQLVRKDGSAFDCIVRACSLDIDHPKEGQIVAVADISEAKLLEAKLQRAEKFEAIGALAGGVAHDLNNILSGIVSYPEVLMMNLPDDSPLRKPLLIMQKSGERAVEVVQDLLTMARRGVCVAEVVNLNHIVLEQLKSPEMDKLKSFHPNVEIVSELEAHLLNIKGSPVHISKCVTNLISNAAEAMPDGGKIAISTRNVYLDTPISRYENIEEGDYVKLSVSDTGVGMSKEEAERIFEPFYTRKKMGRSGTGLGMAVVWGTVKDHDGYIDMLSLKGEGTVFTLYLPVTREKFQAGEIGMPLDRYTGNGESVLVVDDVEEQREIATAILRMLGYSVSSVASGEEACEHMKSHSADLLVLDMIMEPGIDGLDTYKKIIEDHPGQKAIIASGFSRTQRVNELQSLGAGQYVKKPYTLEKIGLAVREELGKN